MVQGLGRVSQSGENVIPPAEGGSRSSREGDHRASSLTSSNPDRAPEPCLFIRLVGGFFSWIGKKLRGLGNACATCFCGAERPRSSSFSIQTEEDLSTDDEKSAESGTKTKPYKDPTAAFSEEEEDAASFSSSEEKKSDSSTSESEEDLKIDPVLEPERFPVVDGGSSISGLSGASSVSDSKQVKKPLIFQEEALKEASIRFKKILQKGTAPDSKDLEIRKEALTKLIEDRERLAFAGRPPGEDSLGEVVALFDQFIETLGDGPTLQDSGLLSDDLTMPVFAISPGEDRATSDRQFNFKRELTKSFIAWLECFGTPAYCFIVEKQIAEIAITLKAILRDY